MFLRNVLAMILFLVVTAGTLPAGAQQAVPDPASVRAYAEMLGKGSVVLVTLTNGSRVRGTLLAVTPDALQVQPRTRIPVAPVELALVEVESIELSRAGMSAGKRVAIIIGIGAAVAAAVGMLIYAAAGV